jgi:hypothetical protein
MKILKIAAITYLSLCLGHELVIRPAIRQAQEAVERSVEHSHTSSSVGDCDWARENGLPCGKE